MGSNNEIKFVVRGDAQPTRRRSGITRDGKRYSYLLPEVRQWMDSVAGQAVEHAPDTLLDGPLRVELLFVGLKPKSVPKRRRFPVVQPDLENLEKPILDAMQKIIYTDDARIVSKITHKRYGDPPRVEITVREITDGEPPGE